MSYVHRTMIVPAGALTAMAQGLCEGLAGADGAGMFVTDLSPTGSAPATHTISAGPIGDDFASLLPLTTVDDEGVATTTPGNVAAIVYLAGEKDITIDPAQLGALLDAIDVSEQPPFEAMARLGGLQMVRRPLP
jgi:hypothetical protein